MMNTTNDGFYPILVTWNPLQGVTEYKFDPSVKSRYYLADGSHLSSLINIGQCENSNGIVLTFDGKILVLRNDKIVDITNKIEDEFKNQGYDYYQCKWSGLAINDNGVIFGKVECFSKHPFKDVPILENRKLFLWSARGLLTFDINQNNFDDRHFYLNNNNRVSFNIYGDKAYVWDMKSNVVEDFSFIPLNVFKQIYGDNAINMQYNGNLRIKCLIAVLDDETIVTSLNDGSILIRNGLSFYQFNPRILNSSEIENKYKGIRFDSVDDYYYPSVNAMKRICVRGTFINEDHPFVIIPK